MIRNPSRDRREPAKWLGSLKPELYIDDRTRLLVLTGAGISAESGVPTFRDANGLWEQHRVEDVASPIGFHRNPSLVWRFYSQRRAAAKTVSPNPGHMALAEIENQLGSDFLLVTQNVDNLHPRAGSKRLIELHGNLFTTRCSGCDREPFADDRQYMDELPECEFCKENGVTALLRPHIVWFGEVPMGMDRIERELSSCDLFVTIGTSGAVYPAAGFVARARARGVPCVYVGPEAPANANLFDEYRVGKAGEAVPALFDLP